MISLVFPAYNEEEALAAVLAEAKQVLADSGLADSEIIVVDDGSTDGTRAVAESAGVRVVSHPQRAGYGRSLKDGILAASNDTVVICDADSTYPLTALPQLLAEYDKGFDMVVAERTGYRERLLKAVLRRFLKWIVEYTAGREIKDINSGFRVFSKKAVTPFFRTLCDTFSFTTSVTLAYMMRGRFVTYTPVPYRRRKGETKIRLMRDSLRTIQSIVQAALYYNPLKIFVLFSVLCCFLAAIGFAGSALFDLLSGFLLGIGGLLVALVVFCFGLLADLLKRILDQQTGGE